jgi:hypothetical protein
MYFSPETPITSESAPMTESAATLEDDMQIILCKGLSINKVAQVPSEGDNVTTPLAFEASSEASIIPKNDAYSHPGPGKGQS